MTLATTSRPAASGYRHKIERRAAASQVRYPALLQQSAGRGRTSCWKVEGEKLCWIARSEPALWLLALLRARVCFQGNWRRRRLHPYARRSSPPGPGACHVTTHNRRRGEDGYYRHLIGNESFCQLDGLRFTRRDGVSISHVSGRARSHRSDEFTAISRSSSRQLKS